MFAAVLDRGHAAMIENELDRRREIGECGRLLELVRTHAEVEGTRRSREPPNVGAKRRALAEVIGNDMKDATKALYEGIGQLTFEEARKAVIFRAAGADGAAQKTRGAGGEVLDISRFGFDVLGRDIDFHVKNVCDATTLRLDGVSFI